MILVTCLLWCSNVQAAITFATCNGGYCKFDFNPVYDWANTSCQQLIVGVVILERDIMMINDTGEICVITDGGDDWKNF